MELLLFILCVILLALLFYRELSFSRERREFFTRLTTREQDFLDRLMAKDLPEVKREQAPPRQPLATSRRQNDQRKVEEARKVDG